MNEMIQTFKIYVTGDAGEDLFAFSQEESHRERPPETYSRRDAIQDLNAPSGAPFIYHLLRRQFESNIFLLSGYPDKGDQRHSLPSQSLMLNHLQLYPKEKRVRISKFDILNKTEPRQEFHWVRFDGVDCESRKLLIIHDGGAAWSRNEQGDEKLLGKQKVFLDHFSTNSQILVNVKELPEVDEAGADNVKTACRAKSEGLEEYPTFRSGFWRKLTEHKRHVACLVSLATLRRAGAAVAHGLSWEHTVEGFSAELYLFRRLKALSQFADLFLRIESAGLIHIRNSHPEAGCRLHGRLYFRPSGQAGNQHGHVIGGNTALINALAQQIKESNGQLDCERIKAAVEAGIWDAIRVHHAGYNVERALKGTLKFPAPNENKYWENGCRLIDGLLDRAKESLTTGDEPERPISVQIPDLFWPSPCRTDCGRQDTGIFWMRRSRGRRSTVSTLQWPSYGRGSSPS